MIVVDASAAVDLFLDIEASALRRRLSAELVVLAPSLIDVEVSQTLRAMVRRREIDEKRGERAMTRLMEFRIVRRSHTALLPRIWSLRANLTAYDAAYVALAEFAHAPLITRDGKLAKSPGHVAVVELV